MASEPTAPRPAWLSTTRPVPARLGCAAHAVYSQIALHAESGGVAYTARPGLIGALLVGAGVPRALAWGLDQP